MSEADLPALIGEYVLEPSDRPNVRARVLPTVRGSTLPLEHAHHPSQHIVCVCPASLSVTQRAFGELDQGAALPEDGLEVLASHV